MPYFRLLVALVSISVFAQQQPPKADQAVVTFAQEAAVRALNFREGDAPSLERARGDFTPEGWADFMKHMQGYLDKNGVPTFDSSFVPSRDATVLGEDKGIVHVRIPGRLTQTQKQSRTTYRAAIEVYAGGKPIKIHRLEQIACAGASSMCE
jgi:hypothetical protein